MISEVPRMPIFLYNQLDQKISCQLHPEELDIIEQAYRMFTFHILFKHKINKRLTIEYSAEDSSADISINMTSIRKLLPQDDDDQPLYYILINKLCEAFYDTQPPEYDLVINHRKKMMED